MGMGRGNRDLCGSCTGGVVRQAGTVRPFVNGRSARPGVPALVAIVSCVLMIVASAMPVSAMAASTVLEAPEQQTVEIAAEGFSRVDGASFGIIGFERLAKGTARASEGAPEGYRLPISDSAGLVVVRAPGEVLLHVDREVAATFDLEDPSGADLSALWSMVCALDEAGSMGGAVLSEGEVPLRLVADSECVSGAFRYRFDARGDDGARYVTVTLANAEDGDAGLDAARAVGVDLGDGVLWCYFAQVVDAFRSRPAAWRWASPSRWGCSPHGASWARRVVSRASSIRSSPSRWCCPPRSAASCCSCCSGNPRPWVAGS